MIRAVVFDCDGVLFASGRANVAFYNTVLAALGEPALDPASEPLAHAMTTGQLFEALYPDDPTRVAAAHRVAQQTDYGPFYALMDPVPGLHGLLTDLGRRYRLAMATNRGTTLPGVLERFGLAAYLEYAVGVHDVPRPKPFPDMLDKCLVRFGVAPAEAVYVGDAPSDQAAARAAGMHFVGVGDGTDAPLRIASLTALPALLATRF